MRAGARSPASSSFKFLIELDGLRALRLQRFELVAHLNVGEMLPGVEQRTPRQQRAQAPPGAPSRAGRAAPPGAPGANCRSPYGVKLGHNRGQSAEVSSGITSFPRRASSRCAPAGSRQSPHRRDASPCASAPRTRLRETIAETSASPCGLRASDSSAPPTALRELMWQGRDLETARVPPTLDSPQSAAPETFLSRDAVSAFPLKYGPLPQPLPGVSVLRIGRARTMVLAILLESRSSPYW